NQVCVTSKMVRSQVFVSPKKPSLPKKASISVIFRAHPRTLRTRVAFYPRECNCKFIECARLARGSQYTGIWSPIATSSTPRSTRPHENHINRNRNGRVWAHACDFTGRDARRGARRDGRRGTG